MKLNLRGILAYHLQLIIKDLKIIFLKRKFKSSPLSGIWVRYFIIKNSEFNNNDNIMINEYIKINDSDLLLT